MLKIQDIYTIFSFCLIFLCSSCSELSGTPAPDETQMVALEECQLSATGVSTRLAAKCGKITVLENRSQPGGRKIDLNIAIIPAVSRSPAPDPLFFLTGGPGQAATELYLQLSFCV